MSRTPFIYFDMGNVLLTFSHELAAGQIGALCEIPTELAWQIIFTEGLHWEYERGELPDEEFFRRFCERARSSSRFVQPSFLAFDNAASAIFELNTRIVPIVASLRAAGCRLGVLSNTSSAHWRYCTRRFPLLETLFCCHALSYRIGVMKPDRRIYEVATRIAGCPPEEILFFDDREENAASARELGWDAVLFTAPSLLAHELKERGIATNY